VAIQTSQIEPHWNYLLAIERDVERLSRYVEFDMRNFECFSMEIARVLMAAAAEADVVCKQLCQRIDPSSKAEKINQYRNMIVAAHPALPRFEVSLARYGLHPWDEWTGPSGAPLWWTAYNKTKHHRHAEYHRANLKNALNAMAGLFVVVLHLYRDRARAGKLLPPARLLRVGERHFLGDTHQGYEFGINYDV
jgi:hypothetical protein